MMRVRGEWRAGRSWHRRGAGPLLLVLCAVLLGVSVPAHAKVPAEEVIADRDITNAVEQRLLRDRAVPFHLIDVDTAAGVVTLSGKAYSLLARRRAARIARSLKGVRSVVNTIRVIPSSRKDAEIRKEIQEALLYDPTTESYEVQVAVKDGVATLTGKVQSHTEKMLAEEVSAGVRGVVGVANRIDVVYPRQRSDAEIVTDVRARLRHDLLVDDALVKVRAKRGQARLSGIVGSARERMRAQADAWVDGVRSVDVEDLRVQWWARDRMRRQKVARDDAAVRRALQLALRFHPRLLAARVHVDVADGVAVLSGVVGSLAARLAAAEVARNTVGVWSVRNHLKVRTANPPPAKEIARAVRRALRRSPLIQDRLLEVDVSQGTAYLRGAAHSRFEKRHAAHVASAAKGVTRVVNLIAVRDRWTPFTDRVVRRDVLDELYWSPVVDEKNVSVEVRGGVVTLRGKVGSLWESLAAARNAREGGAQRVRNLLEIE